MAQFVVVRRAGKIIAMMNRSLTFVVFDQITVQSREYVRISVCLRNDDTTTTDLLSRDGKVCVKGQLCDIIFTSNLSTLEEFL